MPFSCESAPSRSAGSHSKQSQLDAAERRVIVNGNVRIESAVRAADLAARAAWDAEIRERDTPKDPRPNQFAMERRERRERFRNIDDPTDWTTHD
jgi:hypothetical protein